MSLGDSLRTATSFVLGLLVPKHARLYVFGGRHYGGNTAPLFEKAARRGLEPVWLTKNPDVLASGRAGVVDARSLAGLWVAARARAVVLTHSLGDFSPLVFPSRRTRIFNVWHGMPIKRISRADPGFSARSYARSNLREMKRFEAMFVTSRKMAELFARTFDLSTDRVHVTGQPRTDVLFAPPPLDFLDRYDPPLPPHGRRVLYCPTWRENQDVRLFPFEDRDLEAVEAALERLDAVLFVRTHPNDKGRLERRGRRIVPLQGDVVAEITDALPAFDALVTDYSSVYYDYLLLDRPTVFVPYDLAEYARAPGFYLPFEEIVAGPVVKTQEEFLAALEESLSTPGARGEDRQRVRRLVYEHIDGNATERVLDVMTGERGETG